MLSLYRRHEKDCRFKSRGIRHSTCSCPIWCDGYDKHGKRDRRSLKTRDWKHAQERLNGPPLPEKPKSVKIDKAVALYLADCKLRALQPSSLKRYSTALNAMATFLDCPVSSITLERLDEYRKTRSEKAKSAAEVKILRSFLAFCVDRSWIEENFKLKAPLTDSLPTMPFTPGEVSKILDACNRLDHDNQHSIERVRIRARALVLLLLYSGLRISDAIKLERIRLRPDGRLLLRMMKTRSPLYVRLPEHAMKALAAIPVESSQYFFWSGKGSPSSPMGSARKTIARVTRLAGVSNGHPHRFRDTFSVELLQGGADLRTVQLLLGHTSIKTTEKHYAPYVSSMQRILDEAVSKLHFSDAQLPVDGENNTLRDAQKNVLPFLRAKGS